MRVISQNWHIDIPYEQAAFAISIANDCSKIMAFFGNKSFMIGRYSSKDYAMEVLIRLHTCRGDYYILPLDEKETWKGLDYVTSESL